MKIALCFLALVSCAVALPAEIPLKVPQEIDWSKVTPNNIYIEPINTVDIETAELPGSRIVGGTEAVPHSAPYVVALIINDIGFCGGSLISSSKVLTAAHCTDGGSSFNIIAGAHNVNLLEPTQMRLTSTSVTNHPDYSLLFMTNDIAIVHLPSAISFNNFIMPVALAPANAGSYEGSTAILTGWGRTSDLSNALSPVLRGVNLNIISNGDCGNSFGSLVANTTICTSGVGGVSACNGDSGGPLVVGDVQVGVLSFGAQQCIVGRANLYARISSQRSWIQQIAGV